MTQNFFEGTPLNRIPHPPYSPDNSPLEFCLFGKVKNGLIERKISDEIDVLEVVTEILNGILDVQLQRVFRSWIEPFERVTDT
jgi:hypothetical protein